MKRREFLQLAASVAGAARGRLRAQTGNGLPGKFVSRDGLLDAVLESGIFLRQLAGRTYKLAGYNGLIPGPVLEARPGDLVRVLFHNNLDHATNLHFHGMHVTPEGSGDNVLLRLDADQSHLYYFRIPENHPAGLYWYHPHVHGLSNIQVRSGLAGLLNVRGDFDRIGDIPDAAEHDIIYQQLAYFVYDPPHADHPPADHPPPQPPVPGVVAINGKIPELDADGNVKETLKVQQGGLLRLRLLNASANGIIRLALFGSGGRRTHVMHLIANDGVAMAEPAPIEDVVLVPGQRAEVLIKTNQGPGKFNLVELPYDAGFGPFPPRAATRATFEYSGMARRELQVPGELLDVEALPPATAPARSFEFKTDFSYTPPKFFINGLEFDENRVDTRVSLGAIEEWDLWNNSVEDHMFHVHTNRFQAVGSDGEVEKVWRDSLLLPRQRTLRIRTQFLDYPGKTVYHCHALFHEDNSMMQLLEILGPLPPRSRRP